jgi:NADH-quinone oxidoreductase subunit C
VERERQPLSELTERLKARHPDAVVGEDWPFGDLVLTVCRDRIHDALAFFKEQGFVQLLDIVGVDAVHFERAERFEVVYILYSLERDLRVRLKVFVPEDDPVLPTATDLWEAANWAEREVWDMFGIRFDGHPNLVRILLHHEFEGHPLRKDYPIMKGQWATGTRDLREDLERE